jgi:hypothetical protein
LEEGAIGVEAKEESNGLLVEGADPNDNKTRVFLGKPAKDGTKESKEEQSGWKQRKLAMSCRWRDLTLGGV